MNAGEVGILNVGAGDTKLSFDPKDKAETKRAREVVTDMLKRGFCILVEAGRDERGPLYRRVKAFDPKTDEYIIASAPAKEPAAHAKPEPSTAPRRQARKTQGRTERVPASRSRAVAVAPTAGG